MDSRHHERGQRGLDELPARRRDFEGGSEKRLRGRRTQAHKGAWPDDRQFRLEPRPARPNLRDPRLSVDASLASWLPFEVLHDVGHVDTIPRDADRFERLIEYSSSGSHKGLAREVLRIARLFAHEDHGGIGGTLTEYCLCSAFVQVASRTPGCGQLGRPERGSRRNKGCRRLGRD